MSDYNDEFNRFQEEKKQNEEKQVKKEKKGKGSVGKFFAAVFLGFVFGAAAVVAFKGGEAVIDKIAKKSEPAKVVEEAKEENKVEKPEKKADVARPEEKVEFGSVENKRKSEPSAQSEKSDFVFNNNPSNDLTVREVAAVAMPSIVAITNKSVQEVLDMYGMGIREYEQASAGSGIIIGKNDTELLIVTNAHVIDKAKTLTVGFIDGEVYEATVKGSDSDNDIAVIAVSLSDIAGSTLDAIKIATIGDSEALQIGEQVVAIGNAMGYGQSVTTGIVSALNRTIDGSDDGTYYIQTDAAINPGNSGGALLNMDGELVGINSAKLANTKIEGMGYAIPIAAANEIMEDLMNMITRERVADKDAGYLGISGFSVTNEVASAYGIPKGIYVSETTEGAAAEKYGIQKGDVILKFDGMGMDSINKLRDRLDYYKAGETVDIIVARADDGEYIEKTIRVTLDSREGTPLDTSEDDVNNIKDKDGSQDNSESDKPSNGQKSGEFKFGGNSFSYSFPDNVFDFFNR